MIYTYISILYRSKKMKTIAVLVPAFTIDYSKSFIQGIFQYYKDKNVKLLIAQTQHPNYDVGIFDYQYWNSVEILKSQEVDAYIIALGLYTVKMSLEQCQQFFSKFGNRPIICSGNNLELKNSYSILTDSITAYDEIIDHLKNQHGCKSFAFMSANGTNSKEAIERFEAYKTALKKHHLTFNSNLVFEGDFVDFKAESSIKERYHTKQDVDFDALVCANDIMAMGSIKALNSIGVSVPDDVLVTGFDDSPVAIFTKPKLSTINQQIYAQGVEAARLTEEILNGKKIDKINKFRLSPVFRQSCRCISPSNPEYIYKTFEGETKRETTQKLNMLNFYEQDNTEKMNITTIIDMSKISNTLHQLFYNLKYATRQAELDSLYINLYDNPIYANRQDTPVLPDKAELYMYSNNENNTDAFRPGIVVTPSKEIFDSTTTNIPGIYILQPIFSGEKIFGYLTAKLKNSNISSYHIYLKLLNTSISQAYDYTKTLVQNEILASENSKLSQVSKTDELTGLLNRRGFIEQGQKALDLIQETTTASTIIFADMDGLKFINDTYGHNMGDKAIKTQAMVLRKVFRSKDIIGRLSGDEFAIIASGMNLDYIPEIKKKIKKASKELSKQEKLPFELSISIGAVNEEKGSSLMSMLSEADNLLYIEKRRKHSRRNKQLKLN